MANTMPRPMDLLAGVFLVLCLPLLLWQSAAGNQTGIALATYLPVHTVLEIVSIVISGLIFFIAFGTRDAERSIRAVLLGGFFLATAVFDTAHTLSFTGMPDILSPNTADKTIWFWLAARISAGLGLLAYAIWPQSGKASMAWRSTMLAGMGAAVALIFYVILFHESRLPAMYVAGEGPTPLKISVEWLFTGLYVLAAGLVYRCRNDIAHFDARSLVFALLIMAAGELFFTVYIQMSSMASLLGHAYKVMAYSFLYRAIFTETIRQPFLRIKQLNSEVERERDFATSLVNTAPTIILLLDPRGMIQHVNPYFEELTGYRVDEIRGKEWFGSFLPERDRERIRALFGHAIQADSTRGNINPIVTRSGEEREIEWNATPLYDSNGVLTGLLNVGQDVTERVEALALVQSSKQKLRALNESLEARVIERTAEVEQQHLRTQTILNTALEGFFSADFTGRIRDANPAYCAMLGYSEAELLQMSIPDIEGNEDKSDVAVHIEKIMTLGHDRFDTYHRRKDGSLVEVEVSVSQVDIGAGIMFYAFVRDITPRKASEAALMRTRDEAERASAAKSEFLSRMSHELRTPLNAILGFGQLLATDRKHPLTDTQLGNVGEILQAGDHLLELVNEVLDLSRIESGRLEVRLEAVAVAPMIEACLAQIRPLAAQHGLGVTLERVCSCAVQADRMRFMEVLLNLLSNAVKYNREGGSIRVSCTSSGERRVRIGVRDNGRGIAADALPRLFKPFERMESAYEGIEGTGIGLALSKKLVEAMHGEIGVETVQSEGSTFWFELPLAETGEIVVEPTATETPDDTVTIGGGRRKMLYVEDNAANLRLVHKIVATRGGIELLDAGSAEDGLEIAAGQRPELILLDINLPGMDGFEALRQLRDNPLTRDIPVIALTANAMLRDIERGKAAGFDAYLTKPINVVEFFNILDRCLPDRTESKV